NTPEATSVSKPAVSRAAARGGLVFAPASGSLHGIGGERNGAPPGGIVTRGVFGGMRSARRGGGHLVVGAAIVFILTFGAGTGVAAALTVTGMSPTSGAVGTAV